MSKAFELFTAVPKLHNCAQAVAAGAGEESLASELQSCGGGRAPHGRCGALHALLLLTPDKSHAEIIKEFTAQTGSETCAGIKSGTPPYPCAECVRLASELLEKYR